MQLQPLQTQSWAPRVTLLYAFWSSLWILLSDRVLLLFGANPERLVQVSTLKGWLFALVTSLLLYALVRRGEQEQRASYQLLRDIIEGTRDAIFVKDRQGRYLSINSSGAQRLGRPIAAILGQDDCELFGLEAGERIRAVDRVVLETGCSHHCEESAILNGEAKIYLTDKYPRFSDAGEVVGLIGIARDITERKQLQHEREILLVELQANNRDLEALNLITANAISTLQVDALLNVLLDRLLHVTSADLGLIFLERDGELELGARMGEARADERNQFALNREVARFILSTGRLLNIQNLHEDPRFCNYASSEPDARYVLGLPLCRQQQTVGVLQIEWHRLHEASDREVHLLEIAAERCAAAILNAQLFERTQHLQQRLQLQFERMPIGCIVHDRQGCIVDWNPAAERIFGYRKAEAIGLHPAALLAPTDQREAARALLPTLLAGDPSVNGTYRNLTKDGREILCDWHNTPLQEQGEPSGFIAMVQEVTERVRTEEKLRRYAYYDPLTELPLRQRLWERLEELLAAGRGFALLHLDLVRFKVIKYSLGHEVAEQLLLAVTARFRRHLPPEGWAARLSTDEFAILLECEVEAAEALEFAASIERLFAEPFAIRDRAIFVQAQIGVALSVSCPPSPEGILQAADTAMHQAQQRLDSRVALFDPSVQEQAVERVQLDSQMRRALKNSEFQIYYQPIVNVAMQQIDGFEALLRWPCDSGWVSPEIFIPLAEETGFIVALGEWVLRNACTQFQQWRSRYPEAESLALLVNISSVQLMHSNFIALLDQVLAVTGMPPRSLKLEITETAVMQNAEQVREVLAQLQARQIHLCIDDFGTGYSSLSYLRDFPFDTLKVDRSFVMTLERDSKSQELVRTIATLAHNLGMEVVAEGVETQAQLDYLRSLRCTQVQGYFFSRPLPYQEAEQLVIQGFSHGSTLD